MPSTITLQGMIHASGTSYPEEKLMRCRSPQLTVFFSAAHFTAEQGPDNYQASDSLMWTKPAPLCLHSVLSSPLY